MTTLGLRQDSDPEQKEIEYGIDESIDIFVINCVYLQVEEIETKEVKW